MDPQERRRYNARRDRRNLRRAVPIIGCTAIAEIIGCAVINKLIRVNAFAASTTAVQRDVETAERAKDRAQEQRVDGTMLQQTGNGTRQVIRLQIAGKSSSLPSTGR